MNHVPIDLTALGWTPRLAEVFAQHAAEGLVPARVALEHTHIYRVFTDAGEWLARVSGRLRHRATGRVDFPAVGDWVAIEPPAAGADARIRAVLPRSSRFSRRAAGDPTEEQIVAANIDTVFLVSGMDGDFNPRRIERYLVVAADSAATPVIVLNKVDLVDDVGAVVDGLRAMAAGVDIHAVSCRTPESLDVLRRYLGHGQTGALLGSSGVGKSSIVNQLIGHEMMRTREVRISDSRGRHVSTARQLVMLPGHGVIIDTPGMRELQLWDSGEAVGGTFADIEERADGCRFRDCQHRTEPGCAVRAAVEAGEVSIIRLESFHKLLGEQAYQARQQDERAQIEEKRRGKIGAKALQKRIRDKGRS
jgi:ribosome biogenesis GTPase / thiamine phosphate phosphatase